MGRECHQSSPTSNDQVTGHESIAAHTSNEFDPMGQHARTSKDLDTPAIDTVPGTNTAIPARQPRRVKPRSPMTEDSGMLEWKRIDRLLETHVAPALILSNYAQSSSRQQRKELTLGLRHVLLQSDDFRQRSKGKRRAQPMWTEAQWSNVGEFKERLDRIFGPGNITRGQSRAPRNVSGTLHAMRVHDRRAETGNAETDPICELGPGNEIRGA
ncbi:hypothetical protein BD414DRAFT_489856 [Trametes punicea]|nr:hypothetical protein BD414DRAFT_489856 [Trametes punicea]